METSKLTLVAIGSFLLWALWGVFVVLALVPFILRHLTIWPGTLAWALTILPVGIALAIFLVRFRAGNNTAPR